MWGSEIGKLQELHKMQNKYQHLVKTADKFSTYAFFLHALGSDQIGTDRSWAEIWAWGRWVAAADVY